MPGDLSSHGVYSMRHLVCVCVEQLLSLEGFGICIWLSLTDIDFLDLETQHIHIIVLIER